VRGGSANPGQFRTSQNWIGPPGAMLAEAVFVPPPVQQMHEALHALGAYLHAEADSRGWSVSPSSMSSSR